MKPARRDFVTYLSPGTFVSETSTLPIPSWDTMLATSMAKRVVERYGARPYGFRFETRIIVDNVPDGEGGELTVMPKTVKRSGIYFLGGHLNTIDDVIARNAESERILRENMVANGYWIVCVNHNSYRSVLPFEEADRIVNDEGGVYERGDDPRHVAYRTAKLTEYGR